MRTALLVVSTLAAVACAPLRPLSIQSGDTCYRCRRVIHDTRLAGEIIDARGYAAKFRTAECMARYLTEHPQPLKGMFVTDYPSGKLLRAEQATFVRATIDPETNERDYLAFRSVKDAVAAAAEHDGVAIDWLRVMAAVRASTSN